MSKFDQHWKKYTSMNFDKKQGALFPMPCTESTFNALIAANRKAAMKDIARYCYHNKITGRIESDVYYISERNQPDSYGYPMYTINGQKGKNTEWLRLIYEMESMSVHHLNEPDDDRLINIRFMTNSDHQRLHRRNERNFYSDIRIKDYSPNMGKAKLEEARINFLTNHFKTTTIRH